MRATLLSSNSGVPSKTRWPPIRPHFWEVLITSSCCLGAQDFPKDLLRGYTPSTTKPEPEVFKSGGQSCHEWDDAPKRSPKSFFALYHVSIQQGTIYKLDRSCNSLPAGLPLSVLRFLPCASSGPTEQPGYFSSTPVWFGLPVSSLVSIQMLWIFDFWDGQVFPSQI